MNATKPKQNPQEVEISPDAWSRFEHAVDVVAKSPPQHRTKSKEPQSRETGAPKGKAKRSNEGR
jgi:hypothetical protein